MNIPEGIFELIVQRLNKVEKEENVDPLNNWLSNKENRAQYDALLAIWDKTEKKPFLSTSMQLQDFHKVQTAMRTNTRAVAATKYWIAASVVFLIGAFFLLKLFVLNTDQAIYYAQNETLEILLADSSAISLHKGSRLVVMEDFNETDRRVLLEGEGFFNVTHNAAKPFIIKSGKTETKVLGTSFHIAQSDSKVALSVHSGRVSFKSGKQELILAKNQSAYYEIASNQLNPAEFNPNSTAWLSNRLLFKDTDLTQVIADLSKHYSVNIKMADKLKSLTLSTSFDNATLEQVFAELEILLDVTVEQNENGYLIK